MVTLIYHFLLFGLKIAKMFLALVCLFSALICVCRTLYPMFVCRGYIVRGAKVSANTAVQQVMLCGMVMLGIRKLVEAAKCPELGLGWRAGWIYGHSNFIL